MAARVPAHMCSTFAAELKLKASFVACGVVERKEEEVERSDDLENGELAYGERQTKGSLRMLGFMFSWPLQLYVVSIIQLTVDSNRRRVCFGFAKGSFGSKSDGQSGNRPFHLKTPPGL